MDTFMKRALELAVKNVEEGGQPFGAVIVKDGEILAEAVNEWHRTHDVSGHAELLAIRRTQQKLQTDSLAGCIVYASGEPCPMCLSALYLVDVDAVYYAASVEEASAAGLKKSSFIYSELQKPGSQRILRVEQVELQGSPNPLQLWKERK